MSDTNICNDQAGISKSPVNGRKRKRQYQRETFNVGVGPTLDHLQQLDLPEFNLTTEKHTARLGQSSDNEEHSSNTNDWEITGQRKRRPKKIPKQNSSNYPSITFSSNSRLQSQIKITDLQGLVLYILADGTSPQWISVRHRNEIRKVVVLMVPGLEREMFTKVGALSKDARRLKSESKLERNQQDYTSPDMFYPVKLVSDDLPIQLRLFVDMFEHLWPVKTPGDDKFNRMHSPLHAMLTAPLPRNQERKKKKGVQLVSELREWTNKRTPITEYILSAEQLLENDYTLHPAIYSDRDEKSALLEQRRISKTLSEHGWVDTSIDTCESNSLSESDIEQGSLTAGRDIVAMDCEMCLTGPNELSLTRISLISWDDSVILDELVKPDKPIVDYVTKYSGISEAMLAPVTTTLRDIQQKLHKILHSKTILVGHSLNADLAALRLTHPFIVDTALLYPHPRGPPLKSSLKYLAQKYLGREIQIGHGNTGPGAGHDSVEDARACLDLVKQKCEKGPDWGSRDSQYENIFRRLARTGVVYRDQGGSTVIAEPTGGRKSATVDWGDPTKGAGSAADIVIGCKSDEEVMQGVIRVVKGDPDGLEVQGGGVDFVWARMRELERLKGWWNDNRSPAADISSLEDKDTEPTPEVKERISPSMENIVGFSNDTNITVGGSSVSTRDILPTSSDAQEPNSLLLEAATSTLASRIYTIYESLPPCTAFIVYSGSGNPLEMSRLQGLHQAFKREFKIKKWDQLTFKWTDDEDQALKRAIRQARDGIGFVCVK